MRERRAISAARNDDRFHRSHGIPADVGQGRIAFEDELHDLKVVKRAEVAERIKEAREQGDLSENAEYDAAKDEQRDIEARIAELEKILKNIEVIDEENQDAESIYFGCTVHFVDMEHLPK